MADVIEDTEGLVMLAVLGGLIYGGYLLWQKFGAGIAGGASAAAGGVSSAIAAEYENLTFGPPLQAAGTLADTSGQVLGPVSSFPSATDSQGNTYLNVGGTTYQLGPRNAQGNFTALPTSGAATNGASPTGSTSATSASNTFGTQGTGNTWS